MTRERGGWVGKGRGGEREREREFTNRSMFAIFSRGQGCYRTIECRDGEGRKLRLDVQSSKFMNSYLPLPLPCVCVGVGGGGGVWTCVRTCVRVCVYVCVRVGGEGDSKAML